MQRQERSKCYLDNDSWEQGLCDDLLELEYYRANLVRSRNKQGQELKDCLNDPTASEGQLAYAKSLFHKLADRVKRIDLKIKTLTEKQGSVPDFTVEDIDRIINDEGSVSVVGTKRGASHLDPPIPTKVHPLVPQPFNHYAAPLQKKAKTSSLQTDQNDQVPASPPPQKEEEKWKINEDF